MTDQTATGPVNDMRELYALQHAITDAGGTLTPDVHKAIDALRETWDAALRRAQAASSAGRAPAADRAGEWRAAADFVEALNEGCGKPGCAACTTREDVADALRDAAARRVAVLPAPTDQAAVYTEVAELVRRMAPEHPRNASWVQDCHHIADRIDEAGAELRRLAGEAQQDRHACGNCEGVDPVTCLTNPDTAAEAQQDPTQDGRRCGCGHVASIHTGSTRFCAVPTCDCAQYAARPGQPDTAGETPHTGEQP